MRNAFLLPLIVLIVTSAASTRAADEPAAKPAETDKAALEARFAKTMSHSRLIGFYSIVGQEGPPKQDEYTLGAVEKGDGDKWRFNANLQFGQRVMNVPLEIPVLWAGDTPVITVTDFSIPGMGTYTARVMVHGDHYAGTWSSANHGGYLWGRIQHVPETQSAPGTRGEK